MSANKATLKATVQTADVVVAEQRHKDKGTHSNWKEDFEAREDAHSNSGGADEGKATSVLPRKRLADENTPLRFEASTFESDGIFKPAVKLAIKHCYPQIYKRRYPSSP